MGPTVIRPVQDPQAVLSLDNRLYTKAVYPGKGKKIIIEFFSNWASLVFPKTLCHVVIMECFKWVNHPYNHICTNLAKRWMSQIIKNGHEVFSFWNGSPAIPS